MSRLPPLPRGNTADVFTAEVFKDASNLNPPAAVRVVTSDTFAFGGIDLFMKGHSGEMISEGNI